MDKYYGIEFFLRNRHICYCHQRKYLTMEEKNVYDAMATGFLNCLDIIPLPSMDSERLEEIKEMVLKEHCYLFHVNRHKCEFILNERLQVVYLQPKYYYDKSQTDARMWALMDKVTKLVAPWLHLTREEKEKAIYQYLKNHVTYDDDKPEESRECYQTLIEGKGVCIGIAKAAKLLFDFSGFGDSMIVIGKVHGSEEHVLHAWNVVRLNRKYYHVDITFDLDGSGYFNLTDKQIKKDREILTKRLPACTTKWKSERRL